MSAFFHDLALLISGAICGWMLQVLWPMLKMAWQQWKIARREWSKPGGKSQ